MAHLNANLMDGSAERSSGLPAVGSEKAREAKPADTVYRVAMMAGAILLLLTVVWAG